LSQFQCFTAVEENPEQFLKLLRGVLRLDSRAGVAAERDPFVGLQAFDSRKAHLFFGRRREVDELVELLRTEHLIMVVGDSGSGKSSLVRAGLVPAFRGSRLARPSKDGPDDTAWYVVETRPGNNPFGRLADGLLTALHAAGVETGKAIEFAEVVRSKAPEK